MIGYNKREYEREREFGVHQTNVLMVVMIDMAIGHHQS